MKYTLYTLYTVPTLCTNGNKEPRTIEAQKVFRFDQLLKESEHFLNRDFEAIFAQITIVSNGE